MHELPPVIREAIEASDLPPLPQTLLKLLHAVEEEGVTIGDLAGIVEKDPALAAQILSAANSVSYRRSRSLNSIEDCLVALGTRVVRSMATCLAVKRLFEKSSTRVELSGFWRHSLLTAEIARALAQQQGYPRPEEAYLAGLLHDIGQLVMTSALTGDYGAILKAADDEETLLRLESARFGAHHAEVGAWMADRWQLEGPLADGLLFHHEPQDRAATAGLLPRLVWVAQACARRGYEVEVVVEQARALIGFEGDLAALRADAEARTETIAGAMGVEPDGKDSAADLRADLPRWLGKVSELPSTELALGMAVAGNSLMQPFQDSVSANESLPEIFVSLREAARILLGLGRLAFLLVDESSKLLTGAAMVEQPAIFRNFRTPSADLSSIAQLSIRERRVCATFELGNAPYLTDVQFSRALGSEGLLCLPLFSGEQTLGVLLFGISAGQHERVFRQRLWLDAFSRAAAAILESAFIKQRERSALAQHAEDGHQRSVRQLVHETGNPLGVIKSYLRILGEKIPDSSVVRDELVVLRTEIDRVSGIIQRFGNAPEAETTVSLLDLNQEIREFVRFYGDPFFTQMKLVTELDLDKAPAMALCSRDVLRQILLNLLKNASEAMPGGGRMSIRTRSGFISEGRRWSELILADNGPGMSQEDAHRLCGLSLAAAGSEARGNGLSIVNTLARKHSMRIACHSNSASGTCITFLIPEPTDESAALGTVEGG